MPLNVVNAGWQQSDKNLPCIRWWRFTLDITTLVESE